jgi:NAD(P)-dependent dehydrogenase (short-subunit alcohol dehydrogenase family)
MGGEAWEMAADVGDPEQVRRFVQGAVSRFGRLDVLVNNAGYGSYGAVENVPIDEARRQFEVNVFGLARLVQLVTPGMRERGEGRIINISSVGGKFYEPLGAWYHATKFAVEGFSDSLRLELAPYGIRVVIVEPGPIRTEWKELARAHLVSSSAGTPYEHQAEGVRARMAAGDGPMMSGPDVVGRKITRAATARRPRSCYPVGRGAGSVVTARRLLPDRAMDAVISRLYS